MESQTVGRNEPCPCGSKKKYKRCCGVNAAPKLSEPRAPALGAADMPAGFSPDQLDQMDPATKESMAQFAQMFQRLPKGKMQKFQAIMQKAMSGEDVTQEAEAFQKTLPPEMQNLLGSMQMPGPGAGDEVMTPEKARALVEQAAQAGEISSEEANLLLKGSDGKSENKKRSLLGFLKGRKG